MSSVMLVFLVVLLIVFVGLSTRYKWWQLPVSDTKPRIIMYHMVREHILKARFNGLRVKPEHFEAQIRWLHDHGWQFYFLSELIQCEDIPRRAVALTFDDGYEDNYSNVLPVLKKYNARATLFLVVDRFNTDWSSKKKAHHDSGELVKEPKLSDEQVREMIASGCFEIGGHSMTHADFSKIDSDAKRFELMQSKKKLESNFGIDVATYAYPFGIYDQEDRALVAEYGYQCAVTTEEGIDDDLKEQRFELRRIKASGKKNLLYFKLSMRQGLRGLF